MKDNSVFIILYTVVPLL